MLIYIHNAVVTESTSGNKYPEPLACRIKTKRPSVILQQSYSPISVVTRLGYKKWKKARMCVTESMTPMLPYCVIRLDTLYTVHKLINHLA